MPHYSDLREGHARQQTDTRSWVGLPGKRCGNQTKMMGMIKLSIEIRHQIQIFSGREFRVCKKRNGRKIYTGFSRNLPEQMTKESSEDQHDKAEETS